MKEYSWKVKFMSLEAKLVDALNSNNRQKLESIFKKIYDSYFKLVYFCISAYVNKKEDIEDIVSDTFLSIIKQTL